MRTLLLFLALVLIVTIGRRLLRSSRRRKVRREVTGNMVQCAHCGIYIPQQEAVTGNDRFYCSAAHRDADHG